MASDRQSQSPVSAAVVSGTVRSLRLPLLELPQEPELRQPPVAGNGLDGHAKHLGRFLDAQSAEVPQFDDLALPRISPGQGFKRCIESHQIGVSLGRRHQRLVEDDVRALAAALLRAGVARSATFRAIVETLEGSDLIIYIEARPIRLPGQFQFLAASPGCRHVRVSVRTPGLDTEQVAWLGHELWHAVELAEAPDVRNQAGLLRLYQRIGMAGASGTTAEPTKAQEVWTTVLYEARATGRTR